MRQMAKSMMLDMSMTLRELQKLMEGLRREGKAPFLKGLGSGKVRIMF